MQERIGKEIDAAIASEVPQGGVGEPEITFEADRTGEPSGIMKVWELGEHRAELRFLRRPDDDPMRSPWHLKVVGPDPLAGGRVTSVWSRSYKERAPAEDDATDKLREKTRKLRNRSPEGKVYPHTDGGGPGAREKFPVYALYDPDINGLVRKGGLFGGKFFQSVESARRHKRPGNVLVEVSPVDQ